MIPGKLGLNLTAENLQTGDGNFTANFAKWTQMGELKDL
jgi:hypothetical protein